MLISDSYKKAGYSQDEFKLDLRAYKNSTHVLTVRTDTIALLEFLPDIIGDRLIFNVYNPVSIAGYGKVPLKENPKASIVKEAIPDEAKEELQRDGCGYVLATKGKDGRPLLLFPSHDLMQSLQRHAKIDKDALPDNKTIRFMAVMDRIYARGKKKENLKIIYRTEKWRNRYKNLVHINKAFNVCSENYVYHDPYIMYTVLDILIRDCGARFYRYQIDNEKVKAAVEFPDMAYKDIIPGIEIITSDSGKMSTYVKGTARLKGCTEFSYMVFDDYKHTLNINQDTIYESALTCLEEAKKRIRKAVDDTSLLDDSEIRNRASNTRFRKTIGEPRYREFKQELSGIRQSGEVWKEMLKLPDRYKADMAESFFERLLTAVGEWVIVNK